MSQIAIIGILGLMICCSSSSAAMLMMGGDDDTLSSPGPSSLGPSSPGPSSLGPTGPAPPGKVKGWSRTTTGIKNVENISTPEGCVVEAKKVGSPYWIHRNSTHPGMPNSCDIKAWTAPYAGDDADTVHVSGCTYGGNPETGCHPHPSIQGYPKGATNVSPSAEFQTYDPNECVTKGKEVGAKMWGYRTANHPSGPNTCFFYTNANAFDGDAEDNSHISGCVDPTKSLSDACA
jgi:hypothetical protein